MGQFWEALKAGECVEPSCADGVQNGDETGPDCGGGVCGPCDEGQGCKEDTDCAGALFCGAAGHCADATCADGIQNGDETDVDCGGPACAACPAGATCSQDAECLSSECDDGVCVSDGKTSLYPGGWGPMGCNETMDQSCSAHELPAHAVFLDAYRIDLTEVTVGEYALCVQGGGCTPAGTGTYCVGHDGTKADYPVNCTTWFQASQYCEWAGKRLCTEAEWERAARGESALVWPWGHTWDAAVPPCQYGIHGEGVCWMPHTFIGPVGSKPAGMSPVGAFDMAGNVAEWVLDWFAADAYATQDGVTNPRGPASGTTRSVRGGRADSPATALRTSARVGSAPSSAAWHTGLRCCQSMTCDDGLENGLESDIDCGGPDCPKCADGQKCGDLRDCAGGVCMGGVCFTPQSGPTEEMMAVPAGPFWMGCNAAVDPHCDADEFPFREVYPNFSKTTSSEDA